MSAASWASPDRVVGAVLAVLGIAVGVEATTFDVAFMTDAVGPKALPMLSAVVFVVAGVVLMTRAGGEAGAPGRESPSAGDPHGAGPPPGDAPDVLDHPAVPADPADPASPAGAAPRATFASRVRIAAAVAAFAVYSLTLSPLGFWLATTGVVGALSRLFGGPRWGSWLAAATLAAALWLLFVPLLGLPLPIGTLWIR